MPLQARFNKLVVTSNWGHRWYTEVGLSLALDDCRRLGDLDMQLRAQGAAGRQ